MHVLPTYKLRGIPSSPPDHRMQSNEAADKIADVLSYLFGHHRGTWNSNIFQVLLCFPSYVRSGGKEAINYLDLQTREITYHTLHLLSYLLSMLCTVTRF